MPLQHFLDWNQPIHCNLSLTQHVHVCVHVFHFAPLQMSKKSILHPLVQVHVIDLLHPHLCTSCKLKSASNSIRVKIIAQFKWFNFTKLLLYSTPNPFPYYAQNRNPGDSLSKCKMVKMHLWHQMKNIEIHNKYVSSLNRKKPSSVFWRERTKQPLQLFIAHKHNNIP